MSKLTEKVHDLYGEKLRVRVCGICFEGDDILLVHHQGLGNGNSLWAPPGGGMQYGESAHEALIREFEEETGLKIAVKRFLFVHEYLAPPLHGIELFFEVEVNSGLLKTGIDPEMEASEQLITETGYKDLTRLKVQSPDSLHFVLQKINDAKAILNQSGYFKFH